MISAIILADDDIEALGVTLAALVPAVAAGLLKDAVVVDRSRGDHVRVIAEAAGTAYVRIEEAVEPWRHGAQQARAAWVLLLEAGDVPNAGWDRAAEQFLLAAGGAGGARAGFIGASARPGLGDLLRGLRQRFRRQPTARPGLICRRAMIEGIEGTEAGPVRVERLPTRLRRVTRPR